MATLLTVLGIAAIVVAWLASAFDELVAACTSRKLPSRKHALGFLGVVLGILILILKGADQRAAERRAKDEERRRLATEEIARVEQVGRREWQLLLQQPIEHLALELDLATPVDIEKFAFLATDFGIQLIPFESSAVSRRDTLRTLSFQITSAPGPVNLRLTAKIPSVAGSPLVVQSDGAYIAGDSLLSAGAKEDALFHVRQIHEAMLRSLPLTTRFERIDGRLVFRPNSPKSWLPSKACCIWAQVPFNQVAGNLPLRQFRDLGGLARIRILLHPKAFASPSPNSPNILSPAHISALRIWLVSPSGDGSTVDLARMPYSAGDFFGDASTLAEISGLELVSALEEAFVRRKLESALAH